MLSAKILIEKYALESHPEGGWFKETYRSKDSIYPNPELERNISTAIYFLLEKGNFSGFHKIKSDECWHFYAGGRLLIHVINDSGEIETIKLGSDVLHGEKFQYVVPANKWFASEPDVDTDFSFVGCTVAPGFDFSDFELAKAEELMRLFPHLKDEISRLCR
jgi:hypothetical protein